MSQFFVIGSIHMDIVSSVSHFPQAGETIISSNVTTLPGGKGANQAVALARLGATVSMFAKVGDDQYGQQYLNVFEKETIDTSNIHIEHTCPTGMAFIEVEETTSQNRIVVIPGANALIDTSYIKNSCNRIIQTARKKPSMDHYVLLQLEIPLASVELALSLLYDIQNIHCILDPAPAPDQHNKIMERLYRYIEYISPNETEILGLTGIQVQSKESATKGATPLLTQGVSHVIIKCGKYGAYHVEAQNTHFIPQTLHKDKTFRAIDTTAAGDTFNAGFVYALSQSKSIQESISFANIVAGLSTTGKGAQSSMPRLIEVESCLKRIAKE